MDRALRRDIWRLAFQEFVPVTLVLPQALRVATKGEGVLLSQLNSLVQVPSTRNNLVDSVSTVAKLIVRAQDYASDVLASRSNAHARQLNSAITSPAAMRNVSIEA